MPAHIAEEELGGDLPENATKGDPEALAIDPKPAPNASQSMNVSLCLRSHNNSSLLLLLSPLPP